MKYIITGGTGTLGKEIVSQLLPKADVDRIVVYSRDEAKHAALKESVSDPDDKVRYFVGDINDSHRLLFAMEGIDIVIHAAAMKRIDTCEYNPLESIRVNVVGTTNVAIACINKEIKNAIFISSDKACNPISAYGAQKYAGERLWIGMNNMGKTRFNVVRYGNVIASRGSVFQKWEEQYTSGKPLSVSNSEMTRFFWNVKEAAEFVISKSLLIGERGLIYIPKMRSYKIIDLAKEISDNIKITGLRCPEKLHEDLISEFEGKSTYHDKDSETFIIYPEFHEWSNDICRRGCRLYEGFHLSSRC